MDFTRSLADLSKSDIATAGGKGALLGELTRAGFPVPAGFVVLTTAFWRFVRNNGLDARIAALSRTVAPADIQGIADVAAAIQSAFSSAEIPADVAREVHDCVDDLGATLMAVRSSATAEDGARTAWAGQLETFLNTTAPSVLSHIKKCWASLFSPRALAYQLETQSCVRDIGVAAVVQAMVRSEASGTAFSVHPITRDKRRMVIEAAFGLGEAVVSGEITPDRYVIARDEWLILETDVQRQDRMITGASRAGSAWVAVPEGRRGGQKLSGGQIMNLAKIVAAIEEHFGWPCDVEWAMREGQFYITQSRPITVSLL